MIWKMSLLSGNLLHCLLVKNFGISPTAGGGGLGRLRSSPLSPSPSPQVQRGEAELDLGTWTWTRGTWAEVARGAHHWLLSSTPSPSSRSRGVLELGRGVLELKLHEEESKYLLSSDAVTHCIFLLNVKNCKCKQNWQWGIFMKDNYGWIFLFTTEILKYIRKMVFTRQTEGITGAPGCKRNS